MSRNKSQFGFTVIELLVTMGIFSVMTGVVLANYRSFNINAGFANAVEDVYFALREAQVYGAGGKKAGGTTTCGLPLSSFNCAYGVHFVRLANSYIIFPDVNSNRAYDSGTDTPVTTIQLPAGTSLSNVQCKSGATLGSCASNYASVTFKRPNPDAFIAQVTQATPPTSSLDGVEITISNSNGKTAKVVISSAGQISIQ